MEKKLTKNDSRSKKQEKFDVAVAAFEELLENGGLWEVYLTNFYKEHHSLGEAKIPTTWTEWVKCRPKHKWLLSAFRWAGTKQGYETWSYMDYLWHKWICENLNI